MEFFSAIAAASLMGVELQTMRWSGWGIDQTTQSSNDQTLYPSYQASQTNGPPFLWASGEGLFSGPDMNFFTNLSMFNRV